MNEMLAIPNFPIVPTLPDQEFKAFKSRRHAVDKALDKLGKFADSEHLKTAHFAAEIISNAYSNISSLIPEDALKIVKEQADHHANIAGTFADALGLLRGLESIATIAKNLRKKGEKGLEKKISRLETTQAFIDIIGAIGSVLGILDRFKIFELGKITAAMGKIPLIGHVLRAALPCSVVFSIFSIVSSELTVIISALKIKKLLTGIKRTTQKTKVQWNQPIDGAFSENKKNHIAKKHSTTVQNAQKLASELEKMQEDVQTKNEELERKQEAYSKMADGIKSANKVSKFFQKLGPQHRVKLAKTSYNRKIKNYQKTHSKLQTLEKTHQLQSEKILKWQAIENKCKSETLTDSDKKALETLKAEKITKWKAKKVNANWDIAKEVAIIALAILAIAASLVSIGLVIAFSGNVPAAALIAMGAIGLSMTAAKLMHSFYFGRIKKKKVQSIAIPDFRH